MTAPDPFPGMPASAPASRAAPRPAKPAHLTEAEWAELTGYAPTVAAYHARVYRRGPGQCWIWTGAVSDAHGRLRAGPDSRVVISHAYGWHLQHGPAVIPGTAIAHACDESICHNPAHWERIGSGDNTRDYLARRGGGPLADTRGPHGRAVALRDAVKAALAAGASPAETEAAIAAADAEGRPLTLF